MAKRTKKNIVLEYIAYGYDPKDIAEIEGIKIKTVESIIWNETVRYKWYQNKYQKSFYTQFSYSASKSSNEYFRGKPKL